MFDAARSLRAVRRVRRLSQRELADLSGVAAPSIAAIEAGRRNPTVTALDRLLRTVGYRLIVVDGEGREVEADEAHDAIRDRGGRRFPAHLEWDGRPIFEPMGRMWWGWTHLPGYLLDDGSIIPDFVFWHRERPPRDGEWREHPYFGLYQARPPKDGSDQSRPSEGPPEPPPA